jgi:hypothetical protein
MIGTGGATDGCMFGTGDVADVAGLPIAISPPVPDTQEDPMTSGTLLINHTDSTINYTINDQSYSMGPHYTQELPTGQSWVIGFDRGGSFGTARYTLGDGTYAFTTTDQGWDVQKQPSYAVTLDNSLNRNVFNYVFNGAQQTVAAGQTATLNSDYPVRVSFDNGEGQIKQKDLDSGSFKIVSSLGSGIDLYAADAVKPPVADPTGYPVVDGKRIPPGFKLFDVALTTTSATPSTDGSSNGTAILTAKKPMRFRPNQ